MTLTLVKYRLPPSWDGWHVKWDKLEDALEVRICPPPKPERCDCGSSHPPLTARGWRQPKDGETFESTKPKVGRFGRIVHVPTTIPARPVVDLFLCRCQDCGSDEVWDMRTDEWWTLGPEDYGPEGSVRPVEREWSGGLFDLLPDPESQDSQTGENR